MKTIVDLLRAQPAFVSAKAPTAQEVTQAEQSLGVTFAADYRDYVAALGVARLLMGIPFWALAIWVSYLIIATPMHRHRIAKAHAGQAENGDSTIDTVTTVKDE